MTKSYPLDWPTNWPRTTDYLRKGNPFKVTQAQAIWELDDELEKMGATDIVLTSNQRRGESPADPGACVYFTRNGRELSIPCDSYTHLLANIRAIGLTVVALRSIERYGTSDMLEAAFTGFTALPAGGQTSGESWWSVLAVAPDADIEAVTRAYRQLTKHTHPDTMGGNDVAFRRVREAYAQAREALGAR